MGPLPSILENPFADRFEIEELAGGGGMGTVYRARDRYSGALVALKVLRGKSNRVHEAERFDREAQILAELRSPHIVRHVANGQTRDGQRYLAMEWLDGENLAQRIARGPLPLRDCLLLVRRVTDALLPAHRLGIIHRDIKPTNLFLVDGEIDQLKLLDFGIARRVATARAITGAGTIVGTPAYMAPEQARGLRALTPAVDLFALGCVLYECLTGVPPFIADHIATVLARILAEQPTPADRLRPGIPPAVTQLLARLMDKDAAQRIADAAALHKVLQALNGATALGPQQSMADAAAPHDLSRNPQWLGQPGSTAALSDANSAYRGFAENEQSLFCVVLAAVPEAEGSTEATPLDDLLPLTQRQKILHALSRLEAAADFLANDALIAIVPPTGNATDQVSRAARVALLVKGSWPAAVVALATGRGSFLGRTSVGEVVELAARTLKDESKSARTHADRGVLIDVLSANLLDQRFLQLQRPGGALLLAEDKDSDASRRLLGKPTPCVGREVELRILESQFEDCIEAREARAVLVTAPAGGGKTRLRHEFIRRLLRRDEAVTVLLGRSDAMNTGTPYAILNTAIRKLCGISASDSPARQREQLRARISQHLAVAQRERVVVFIGELCGVPFPAAEKPMLQAARQEHKIMLDCVRCAVLDWLLAERAAATVVLVLDDLQWGDELTVAVIDESLRTRHELPLFVLALARPEFTVTFPELWSGRDVQQIALKGLSKKACERLIMQVVGKDVTPEAVTEACHRSAGNPLFLEELIRGLAAGLRSEVPATVLAMLQARVGQLDSGARRAVRAAAVFGQNFWRGGIAAVLGAPSVDAQIDQHLHTLVQAEFIQPKMTSSLIGQKEFGFRHALVRDAVYMLLTETDLTTGHRAAGEFLETAGAQKAGMIADHYKTGGERLRAATFYLRAADESYMQGDYLGSLRCVERGLSCEPEGELLGSLSSVQCLAAVYLNRAELVGRGAGLAMTLLRPGSLGWCRAMPQAIAAAMHRRDAVEMMRLISRLLATTPDADARASNIETLAMVQAISTLTMPDSLLQAVLKQLSADVALAAPDNPSVGRWLGLARMGMRMYREPTPWSLVRECQCVLDLCDRAGDVRLPLLIRGYYVERGWIDLGDLAGARHRLAMLESLMTNSPAELVVPLWRLLTAQVLCSSPQEADWNQAEQIVSPILSHAGGFDLHFIVAREVMVRLALQRGRPAEGEALARTAMQLLPIMPVVLIPIATLQIRALLALVRFDEAAGVAEQVLGTLAQLGATGVFEVEFRLTASEAFHAAGNTARAFTELRETLHQIQLRADDITDPFWKNSYFTRNPSCVRARQLGVQWGLPGDA